MQLISRKIGDSWPGLHIHNKRWFAIAWLVVTGLFLGIIVMGLHIRNSDRVQAALAAENLILIIQADDAGQAYDLGTPAFRQATTEDNLRLVFDRIGPYVRQARLDLVDSSVPANTRAGNHIGYVYRASKPKSTTYIRIVLEKQQGRWLVYGLHTSNKPLSAAL